MLPTYKDHTPPPSSPASQPASDWPDSSPITEPLEVDSEPDLEAPFHLDSSPRINPYSGSYRGLNKRPSNAFTPPVSPRKRSRREAASGSPEPTPRVLPLIQSRAQLGPRQLEEDAIWDDAGTQAFHTKSFVFQLDNKGLSAISVSFLKDLKSMIPPPTAEELFLDNDADQGPLSFKQGKPRERMFTRVQTAPVFTRAVSQKMDIPDKTKSSGAAFNNSNVNNSIELYLSNNRISKLPGALWDLRNITVLILRGNQLTYLPPEIGQLKNLVELNVANNRLRFIPSELFKSRIKKILLHPNNFYPRPPTATTTGRHVGETLRISKGRVPALSELALRRAIFRPQFLSLEKTSEKPRTILEQTYSLPLHQGIQFRQIPSRLVHILATCIPGSIPPSTPRPHCTEGEEEQETAEREITGVGVCPNPDHKTKSIFVQHAEERFTWETFVAGERAGGEVPVRWRGCGKACLDFLDPANRDPGGGEFPLMTVDVAELRGMLSEAQDFDALDH